MSFFTLNDSPLYQWDSGVKLTVDPVLTDDNYVHFALPNSETVYSLHPVDGEVEIPSQILQNKGLFNVYAYVMNENGDKTLVGEQFYALERPKPPEYVDDPTPVITYPELEELVSDLETLQTRLSNWTATVNNATGTPSVTVTLNDNGINLAFKNLKGAKGDKGDVGVPSVSYDATSKKVTIAYT